MKNFLGILILPIALVIISLALIIIQIKVFWKMWVGKDKDENTEE